MTKKESIQKKSKIFRQFAGPIVRPYFVVLRPCSLLLLGLLSLESKDVLVIRFLNVFLFGLIVDAHVPLLFILFPFGFGIVLLLAWGLQVHSQIMELLIGPVVGLFLLLAFD